ncbi:hypothetical protein Mal64_38570 [Pseudobythopirellula maris]|uniref:Uncharacterized protein n=1 Tax=Pseudobythopirellula maris TaxID=2527991 RepID=A0A5C5ZGY1_9BACT|nr:hypothetical protein [Pseudobythopirellula maris]TWT86317.1 hypothetical protein Mal64_38570 [Pseudobythopirellula maris]
MGSVNLRGDRRRRLMQEGSIQGTKVAPVESNDDQQRGAGKRYALREGSLSFAMASGLTPRSPWGVAGLAAVLALIAAAVVALGVFRGPLLGDAGAPFALGALGTLAAWHAQAAWLLSAVGCVVLFGLRRQRIDDFRGNYRWWLLAAAACVALSLNASTGLHAVVASALGRLTGWSPLAGDAFWWLVPGVLALGYVVVRAVLDLKESTAALLFSVAALGCFAFNAAAVSGLAVAAERPIASHSCAIAVPVLVLLAIVSYARRAVLETEGVVAAPQRAEPSKGKEKPTKEQPAAAAQKASAQKSEQSKKSEPRKPELKLAAEPEEPATRAGAADRRERRRKPEPDQPKAQQEAPQSSTQWTNGAEGGEDDYGDGPERRKLSKAERKRLRREKARRAA